MLARIARAKAAAKSYASAREGLLLNAGFVAAQFEALDAASGHKAAVKFGETAFAASLAKEAGEFRYVGAAQRAGGGVVIAADPKAKGKAGAAGGEGPVPMDADEEFARQLQAKMDAEARQR